jgi:hypothetical protein
MFNRKVRLRIKISFDIVKKYSIEAHMLWNCQHVWPVVIETDSSGFAMGAVLSQVLNDQLHPIAYHSCKMDKAKINNQIHDTEMLMIVSAFKARRCYFDGTTHSISVFTDHNNLEYFTTTNILNRRHGHWTQKLAGYDLKIFYQPGCANGKLVALSRCLLYCPKTGEGTAEENEKQPIHCVLRTDQLVTSEGETGQVTVMKLRGALVVNSSAKLRAIPAVKFNSWG